VCGRRNKEVMNAAKARDYISGPTGIPDVVAGFSPRLFPLRLCEATPRRMFSTRGSLPGTRIRRFCNPDPSQRNSDLPGFCIRLSVIDRDFVTDRIRADACETFNHV